MKDRLKQVFFVVGVMATAAALAGGIGAAVVFKDGFSARPEPSTLEAKVALTARSMAVPSRLKAMKNPVSLDAKSLRGAMEHWADHCATCHGNDGTGSDMGKHLYPRAPDMRAARTQDMTDGELYAAINQGVRLTGMPAWGKSGDDDRSSWELVAFIRELPRLKPEQLEEMKGMNPVPAAALKRKQADDDFLNDETSEHDKH